MGIHGRRILLHAPLLLGIAVGALAATRAEAKENRQKAAFRCFGTDTCFSGTYKCTVRCSETCTCTMSQ